MVAAVPRLASPDQIAQVVERIVRLARPWKVILFGSYATGRPSPDSDVDLLVILPFEGSPVRKALEIDEGLEHPFPLDLLVRTPAFIEERMALGDFFIRDILEKGQVLYDAADAGMDR